MLTKGTILVCIDDEHYDKSSLTYGNQYVLDEDFIPKQRIDMTVIILDNNKQRAALNRHRFITLQQHREQQLSKIL